MAILQAGTNQYRYSLQPGESLSITTDAASSCRYAQLASAPTATDMPSGGMIAVAASSTITIGQSSASRWLIESVVGPGCNVTQNAAAAVADLGAPVDLAHFYGSGAPGASFAQNQAQTGSLYTDVTNGKLYINSGTKSAVSWRLVTSA